jgi:hypothetical protein
LVQLGLHPPYPQPRRNGIRPRLTGIHQRLRPLQYVACMNPLDPFAMWTAFPPSDYYGSSAPPPNHQQTTRLSATPHLAGRTQRRLGVVPAFTMNRSSGEVPSYTPAASPRLRRRHSPWPPESTTSIRPRSSPPQHKVGARRYPAQIHRVRAGGRLEGR